MKNVTLSKTVLIEILRTNRDEHAAEFATAIEGYRQAAQDAAQKMVLDLVDGSDVSLFIRLDKPEDHTVDYDRVIRMLELEQSDSVVLTMTEFAHYVDNDWDWMNAFKQMSSVYTQ